MKTKLTRSQIDHFLTTAETVDAKLSTAAFGLDIIWRKAADAGVPISDVIELLVAQGYPRVAETLTRFPSKRGDVDQSRRSG